MKKTYSLISVKNILTPKILYNLYKTLVCSINYDKCGTNYEKIFEEND